METIKAFCSQDIYAESYVSPITVLETEMRIHVENGVYKAVKDVGFDVDKEELIRALRYDREQYKKGYEQGYRDGYYAAIKYLTEGRDGDFIQRQE